MRIIDTFVQIEGLCAAPKFDIEKWTHYIKSVNPELESLIERDMKECIQTGAVTFEDNYLPVLNALFASKDARRKVHDSFLKCVNDLEHRITAKFGKCPDTDIVLYLGLCNGAGWVTEINGRITVLLGVEKIVELDWCDQEAMNGLLYHELGHVYQRQYGTLERTGKNSQQKFLWQLFTEGIAMYFEQVMVGCFEFYHQDSNGWISWCEENFEQIKHDFTDDLNAMTFENQRYFGDWVTYMNHVDVGYYLGCRFIQFILNTAKFDDIVSFDLDKVSELYSEFIK